MSIAERVADFSRKTGAFCDSPGLELEQHWFGENCRSPQHAELLMGDAPLFTQAPLESVAP